MASSPNPGSISPSSFPTGAPVHAELEVDIVSVPTVDAGSDSSNWMLWAEVFILKKVKPFHLSPFANKALGASSDQTSWHSRRS